MITLADRFSILLIVIASLLVLVFICTKSVKTQKKFSKAAIDFIKQNFPYLELRKVVRGGVFSRAKIHAIAYKDSAPIQSLYIRETVQYHYYPEGYSDQDLMINAVLLIPEAKEYGRFIITLRKQGIVSKMVYGENVLLGIRELDERFLIRSDRPDIARKVLRNYSEFLTYLGFKGDLEGCRIQAYQGIAEFTMIFGRFNADSLTGALYLFKILEESIVERQKQIEAQQLVPTSVPSSHSSKVQQSKLATDQEIIDTIKRFEYKFESLQINVNKAEIRNSTGFFKEVKWEWSLEKITVTAQASLKEPTTLKIEVTHSSTNPTSRFNWFNPLDNLSISVDPPELKKEFGQSYDIIRAIQGMDHRKHVGKIKYTINREQTTLVIEVEKTKNNIERCFELLEAGSWKWLSRFVLT